MRGGRGRGRDRPPSDRHQSNNHRSDHRSEPHRPHEPDTQDFRYLTNEQATTSLAPGVAARHANLPNESRGRGRGKHAGETHPTSNQSSKQSIHPDCLICVSPIIHHTIADCAHAVQICATCSLRLKLFVKSKQKDETPANEPVKPVINDGWACPYCRKPWEAVCFSREMRSEADHEMIHQLDINKMDLSRWNYDQSIKVYFEDSKTQKQFFKLRSIYCVLCEVKSNQAKQQTNQDARNQPNTQPNAPATEQSASESSTEQSNNQAINQPTKYFTSISALNRHLKTAHDRYTCDACITTRKVFMHEHEFFTQSELINHFRNGSPGTAAHGPIEPHPNCQFCNQPFFSNDELYAHLTNSHRSCRFCDGAGSQKWYRDDGALKRHFQRYHFYCDQGDCAEKLPDYCVFRDEVSLKAHQLNAHVDRSSLTQAQLKQMARVDLSAGFFDRGLPRHSGDRDHSDSQSSHRHDRNSHRSQQSNPSNRRTFEAPTYSLDDDDDGESFPSLSSTSLIEQRARAANEDLQQRSQTEKEQANKQKKQNQANNQVIDRQNRALYSNSTPSMHRSYSQPHQLGGSKSFNPADFPSLGGGAPNQSIVGGAYVNPNAHLSRPMAALPDQQAQQEYPGLPGQSLDSSVKTSNKLRLLKNKPAASLVAAPKPIAATSQPQSNNWITPTPPRAATASPRPETSRQTGSQSQSSSGVPIPLPASVSPAEAPARNQQLISDIRTLLSQTVDQSINQPVTMTVNQLFDQFRTESSKFRNNETSASEFLQYFYLTFHHDAQPFECERILMELIALLPDEEKRIALHSEYAKHKVFQKLSGLQTNKQSAKPAKPAAAVNKPQGFTAVPTRSNYKPPVKATIQSNQNSRIASVPFEGREVRPLKRDDEDDSKELAKQREAEERAAKERELVARREERRAAEQLTKAQLQEKLRTEREKRKIEEAAAAARAAEFSGDSEAFELARAEEQRLEDERLAAEQDERERELRAKVLEAEAKAKNSRKSPAQAINEQTIKQSGKQSKRVLHDQENPPLRSSAPYISNQLADPTMLDFYVANISALSSELPDGMLATLNFLSTLLFSVIDQLSQRHAPDFMGVPNRRFCMTDDSRTRMHNMINKLKFNQLTEFGRLAQLGLMPNSINQLSSAVSMARRFSDDSLLHDWLSNVLGDMKSAELYLLYEWLHGLLGVFTDSEQAEVQAAIHRSKQSVNQSTVSLDDRKLVPLQRDDSDDEEHAPGNQSNNQGNKKQAAKKKGKQLLFFGGSGIAAER